jgi:hypothetical protein
VISSPGSTVDEELGIRVSAGRTVEEIQGSQKYGVTRTCISCQEGGAFAGGPAGCAN